MGLKRVIGSGIAGMLCLLPMAWISFYFLDLPAQITGGLIQNTAEIGSLFGGAGQLIGLVIGMILGLVLICLFPVHWALIYQPNDLLLLTAIILPWILCCAITSGLFAHSPRGGLHTSIAIGLGWMILFLVGYALMRVALGPFGTVLDAAVTGFTDMPFALAVITATMEGALIGGIFGSFVGSLKYEPEGGSGSSSKKKKKKKDKDFAPEPTFDSMGAVDTSRSSTVSDFCTNCGAKLTGSDDFCTNCGAKKK